MWVPRPLTSPRCSSAPPQGSRRVRSVAPMSELVPRSSSLPSQSLTPPAFRLSSQLHTDAPLSGSLLLGDPKLRHEGTSNSLVFAELGFASDEAYHVAGPQPSAFIIQKSYVVPGQMLRELSTHFDSHSREQFKTRGEGRRKSKAFGHREDAG